MIKKVFCFDIDGTICITKNGQYNKSKPIKKNILSVNSLYDKGHKIIFFTSRFMTRYKISDVKKKGHEFTSKQLRKWGVKYHKLIMGKPEYDFIIDDKSIFYDKKWSKFINENEFIL